MRINTSNHLYRYAFIISIILGLVVWFLDALLDYLFFYQGYSTFLGLLITDIPPHEIYIRVSVLILFAGFGLFSSYYLKKNTEAGTRLKNIYNNIIPICITDNDFTIIDANRSYQEIFGPIQQDSEFIKCHDSRPGPKCKTTDCPLYKISQEGKTIFTCESTKTEPEGGRRHFVVTATPFLDPEGNPIGIIETFQDITARKKLEDEREILIQKLQSEKEKVKTLSGFLPICASCKKIRDDKGYWNQIESYIKEHSEAEFSHGICPECAAKLYGDLLKDELKEDKE